jgi:hypothetical protein
LLVQSVQESGTSDDAFQGERSDGPKRATAHPGQENSAWIRELRKTNVKRRCEVLQAPLVAHACVGPAYWGALNGGVGQDPIHITREERTVTVRQVQDVPIGHRIAREVGVQNPIGWKRARLFKRRAAPRRDRPARQIERS